MSFASRQNYFGGKLFLHSADSKYKPLFLQCYSSQKQKEHCYRVKIIWFKNLMNFEQNAEPYNAPETHICPEKKIYLNMALIYPSNLNTTWFIFTQVWCIICCLMYIHKYRERELWPPTLLYYDSVEVISPHVRHFHTILLRQSVSCQTASLPAAVWPSCLCTFMGVFIRLLFMMYVCRHCQSPCVVPKKWIILQHLVESLVWNVSFKAVFWMLTYYPYFQRRSAFIMIGHYFLVFMWVWILPHGLLVHERCGLGPDVSPGWWRAATGKHLWGPKHLTCGFATV